jgi:hypothetical protein
MGDGVWTFGYPLTENRRLDSGHQFFMAHPRLLRGHILRVFRYDHPSLGMVPSWELSFAVPPGLSGAPLFRDGTLDVVGVVYGNNDVSSVEEIASIDPGSGARIPEVRRIMSFGLAHHSSILERFSPVIAETRDGPFID